MITRQELEKMVEEEAERMSAIEAKPMLRDMWPLSSRGTMKNWFHHFFLLGTTFVSEKLWGEIETLKAENQRIKAALMEYGSHSISCAQHLGDDCFCGFEDAITPPNESELTKQKEGNGNETV